MGVTIEDFSPCHCRKRAEPGPGTSQWCAVSFSSVWYVDYSPLVRKSINHQISTLLSSTSVHEYLCYIVRDLHTLTICMAWCKSNGLSRLCSWLSFQARAPEKSQQVQHRWEWTQALLRRHFVPDNKSLLCSTLETIRYNHMYSEVSWWTLHTELPTLALPIRVASSSCSLEESVPNPRVRNSTCWREN